MILEFHELEFFEKIVIKFAGKFFMEFEFIKLEFHGKLEFPKFEYPKCGRFLHISETVVN